MATDRLGLVLSTVTDAPPREFVAIGKLCEEHGYENVLVNEGRGDALACSQAIAQGTRRIHVGTNIANIFLRHPFLAASTARTIADLSGGRLVLGLGMSHRGMLKSLGIDMGDARAQLREYAQFVQRALDGNSPGGPLGLPASAHRVPVYVAGNTVESAIVAGEVGAGIMPFLSPRSYLPSLVSSAREAARAAGRNVDAFGCIMSIPTFVSDDTAAARSAARYNLAYFAQLPNYRRQWRRAGFVDAMNALQKTWETGNRREAAAQVPDALVDEVCVFGRPEHCREQLQAFREAGADVPVLAVSPVNEDRLAATRKAIVALRPR